ncbi:MAG: hypothetical protein J6C77_06165 [Muribaculaceae bacterium]|nr:hypothetical protein [Muribaculaceae bacterium]
MNKAKREAYDSRTVTDTDSYAFLFFIYKSRRGESEGTVTFMSFCPKNTNQNINMRTLTTLLLALVLMAPGFNVNAKNYFHKEARPAASDHTWYGYDYNFNISEDGYLSGTNTFSIVYNSAPTKWHNTGYYGEGIRMYTGHETLTITVLPGDKNYKYVLSTQVVEWQWDTHQLKWVKRRNMPTNGTRTFIVKNWMLSGPFEVPTTTSASGVNFVCGNSVDGVIPDNSSLSWKVYDYSKNTPQSGLVLKSEGDSLKINVLKYLEDVEKIDVSGNNGLARFGTDQFGICVELAFPYVKGQDVNNILDAIASMTQDPSVRKCLEKYSFITLPYLYYDNYIDPYAPVTTILPNGHKLVSTLQPDNHVYTLETWEEDGYSYAIKNEGSANPPTIGTKTVDGKKYIHVIRTYRYDNYEEKGFFDNGKYYLTYINRKERDNPIKYEIDWTPYESDGYCIISDSKGKKYAVAQEDSERHTYYSLNIPSAYTKQEFEYYIFKEEAKDGTVTVSANNTPLLSSQAKEFIRFVSHPYIREKYKSAYKIIRVTMDSDGNVILSRPVKEDWQTPEYYKSLNDRFGWEAQMLALSKRSDNPLTEAAALIGMELDVPDYDVEKIEAKVIGKRAARLLKKLVSLLNQKVNQKGEIKIGPDGRPYQDIWPNSVKRAFLKDNRWNDFKKAWVSRIVKQGSSVTVWITTINDRGVENTTEMRLQDNVPIDEHSIIWIHTAQLTK